MSIVAEKIKTEQQTHCLCGSSDESSFMICCDHCGVWYHGACLQVILPINSFNYLEKNLFSVEEGRIQFVLENIYIFFEYGCIIFISFIRMNQEIIQ